MTAQPEVTMRFAPRPALVSYAAVVLHIGAAFCAGWLAGMAAPDSVWIRGSVIVATVVCWAVGRSFDRRMDRWLRANDLRLRSEDPEVSR